MNLLCPQTGQLQVTDASLDSADTNTDQASHPKAAREQVANTNSSIARASSVDLSGSSSTAPADPPRPGTAIIEID